MGILDKEQPVTKKKRGRPGPTPGPCMVKCFMYEGPHQTLRVEAAKRGMSTSAYAHALILQGLGYDHAPAPKGQGGHEQGGPGR